MRVILTSHGSTGDIFPIIALAVALKNAGHDVTFATIPHYRADIESAGIAFYALSPNWQQADLSYWMGRLNKIRTPIYQLRELYLGARAHIPEMIRRMDAIMPGADLLVSSYLFPMNRGIAERHGVPFVTYAFAPHVIPSPDYPPENIPSPRWLGRTTRHAWNRWLWSIGNAVVDRTINASIVDQLRAAGLPKVRNFFSKPAECVLVGVSEKLLRPADAEIDPRFRYTGYCRWQAPVDVEAERELLAFTGGEPVPVLTFGSMVYDQPGAAMERLVRAWPTGQKLVVQRGWAQFPQLGDERFIKVLGKMSHDQLFRHASCVIHHGGAGTTASVLHAGKPQIVVPHIGDQKYFGGEVVRLGCGVVLAKKHWPEHLHRTIASLLSDSRHATRAQAVALQLAQENGPANAVKVLEEFVRSQRPLTPLSGREVRVP